MSIEIKSPTFPESVADGTIAKWLKKEGDLVNQDEVIVEIETDKVVLEVLAQSDGVVSKIIKPEGEIVASSELIGEFEESEKPDFNNDDFFRISSNKFLTPSTLLSINSLLLTILLPTCDSAAMLMT